MRREWVEQTMTEEEQAAIWQEVAAGSQPIGEKSRALLDRTPQFTLTLNVGPLMLVLPDDVEVKVTARKNAGGDGYHVASFKYDAGHKDIFEEINLAVFKERLARFVAREGEDIFLGGHGLDWRD
jgi:hypothetical protein